MSFVVVENEPSRLHLVLPCRPGDRLILLPVFDAGGTATQQWTLPAGAKSGDYEVLVSHAGHRRYPENLHKEFYNLHFQYDAE